MFGLHICKDQGLNLLCDKARRYISACLFSFCVGVFCLSGLSSSAYASATAEVNRIDVAEGGSLVLTIRSNTAPDTEPNIIPLQKNFLIRGRKKSSQTSYVNGKVSTFIEWKFTISPKQAGRLVIPEITVGSDKTAPINIVVSPASASAKTGGKNGAANGKQQSSATGNAPSAGGYDVFMESAVNTRQVYEGSQILYVVRLFFSTAIESGTWPNPSVSDAIVEKIGDDLTSQNTRAGKTYTIIERRYAIFPEKAGEFVVPASEFSGNVMLSPVTANVVQIGGFGALNAFFNPSEPVRVRSNEMSVKVLPKPAEAKGKWWLPAYNMSLSLTLKPSSNGYKVNEAIEGVLEVKASGLAAALLPDIYLPNIKGIKIYPSKSEKSNSLGDKGIVGKITKTFVMIPQKAGTYTIPAISLDWWNLAKKTNETATMKEYTFTVQKAEGDDEEVNPEKDTSEIKYQNEETGEVVSLQDEVQQEKEKQSRKKKIIIVTCSGLLLIAAFAVLFFMRRMKRSENDETAETINEITKVSLRTLEKELSSPDADAKKISEMLVAWARVYFDDENIFNVSRIAERLPNQDLKDELQELNRSIYSRGTGNFDGQLLLKALKEALSAKKRKDKEIKPVPDLYPE